MPYNLLDERTKKTNRDSVNNAVRTLIGYGYNIEPPDQESSKLAYLMITCENSKLFNSTQNVSNIFVLLNLICHLFLLSLQLVMALRTPAGTRYASSGQRSRTLSPKGSGTLSLRQ